MPESKTKEITSFEDFVSAINEIIKEKDEASLVSQSKYFFRGQSKKNQVLLPSIARKPSPNISNSLLHFENKMVEDALRLVPETFMESEYTFNLLSKLQHYGVPTRLLDITRNALCALYFACSKDQEEAGEVYVFKENDDTPNYKSADANVMADFIQVSYLSASKLDEFYEIEQKKKYFWFHDDSENDEIIIKFKERIEKPIVVLPKEEFERQKRQQGAFILFPNQIKDNSIIEEIKPIEKDDDMICRIIEIPSKMKKATIKLLESYGISKPVMFGDSVDVQCECIADNIKERYCNSKA